MRQTFVLFLLLCVVDTWTNSPVDSVKYSIPQIFEKQREVIYGENEAEIYFSFIPRFKIDHAALILTSSHPDHLAIKSQDKHFITTSYDFFTEKDLISKIRVKVVRLGEFSMASLKIKLEYKFPTQEVFDWIQKDPKKKYLIPEAREKLLRQIKSSKGLAEEVIGVFLYHNRFLAND